MPRTIEGIVESHQAASARRKAGQPIWDRRVQLADIFRDEDRTFEERRDEIVRRLRASGWTDENPSVAELVEELAETDDVEYFDSVWDYIYDHADVGRVWLATF